MSERYAGTRHARPSPARGAAATDLGFVLLFVFFVVHQLVGRVLLQSRHLRRESPRSARAAGKRRASPAEASFARLDCSGLFFKRAVC